MKDIKIVIGGNFGDEGKGLMTDYFATEAVNEGRKTLVICSNGGAQRGHTVVTPKGIRHVFHHFGSGTLAGADTWLPRFFIVNPMIFMNEYKELLAKGVRFAEPRMCEIAFESKKTTGYDKIPEMNIKGIRIPGYEEGTKMSIKGIRIIMDPECPVTTPFDMITNQILEDSRGGNRHGSCGVGIWETLLRDGLFLGKMEKMSDSELYQYLDGRCRVQLIRRLDTFGIREIPEKWRDIIYSEDLLLNYIQDFREMCRIAEFCSVEVMKEYDRVIFEAGQGLLLDRLRKEYGCHTTPSNTGLRNPAEMIREYISHIRGEKQGAAESELNDPSGNEPDMQGNEYNDPSRNPLSITGNELSHSSVDYPGMQADDRKMDVEVCYVTRTYLTRHGAGPFKEECRKDEINPEMKDLTNVPNPHQGTLRYGKLDIDTFLRRIREDYDSERFPEACNARMTWAVTHVNEYMPAGLKERKLDYSSDGETYFSVAKIGRKDGESIPAKLRRKRTA